MGSESELKVQIWKSAYDGFGKAATVLRLPRRKNIQRTPKSIFWGMLPKWWRKKLKSREEIEDDSER